VTDYLDASSLLRWCVQATGELRRHASEIDALIVFPVADADTSTNMSLTMDAVARAVEPSSPGAQICPVQPPR